MVADKKSSAGEITDKPIHENGGSSAGTTADQDKSERKPYRTEEFVRVRKQLTEKLDRVKEELAQVDAEDVGRRLAHWVKENPLLAAVLAAGTGILLGRGLMSLFSSSEPPTLSERTRRRAHTFSRQAQKLADEVGDAVSGRVADAGDLVLRKAGEARSEVTRKAGELSDEIGRLAAEVAETLSETRARAAGSTKTLKHDTAEYVRDTTSQGREVIESFLGTVRAAAADHVARRLRDWLRRLS